MPITRITSSSTIDRAVEAYAVAVRKAILYKLHYVGERCIIEARTSGSYRDQTGNLRSSIGYAVVMDGEVVDKGGFQVVKNGAQGATDGEKLLDKIVSRFPKDIVLVVCAGMKYAAFVTAKGLNVIDSAELLAQQLVAEVIKQLNLK